MSGVDPELELYKKVKPVFEDFKRRREAGEEFSDADIALINEKAPRFLELREKFRGTEVEPIQAGDAEAFKADLPTANLDEPPDFATQAPGRVMDFSRAVASDARYAEHADERLSDLEQKRRSSEMLARTRSRALLNNEDLPRGLTDEQAQARAEEQTAFRASDMVDPALATAAGAAEGFLSVGPASLVDGAAQYIPGMPEEIDRLQNEQPGSYWGGYGAGTVGSFAIPMAGQVKALGMGLKAARATRAGERVMKAGEALDAAGKGVKFAAETAPVVARDAMSADARGEDVGEAMAYSAGGAALGGAIGEGIGAGKRYVSGKLKQGAGRKPKVGDMVEELSGSPDGEQVPGLEANMRSAEQELDQAMTLHDDQHALEEAGSGVAEAKTNLEMTSQIEPEVPEREELDLAEQLLEEAETSEPDVTSAREAVDMLKTQVEQLGKTPNARLQKRLQKAEDELAKQIRQHRAAEVSAARSEVANARAKYDKAVARARAPMVEEAQIELAKAQAKLNTRLTGEPTRFSTGYDLSEEGERAFTMSPEERTEFHIGAYEAQLEAANKQLQAQQVASEMLGSSADGELAVARAQNKVQEAKQALDWALQNSKYNTDRQAGYLIRSAFDPSAEGHTGALDMLHNWGRPNTGVPAQAIDELGSAAHRARAAMGKVSLLNPSDLRDTLPGIEQIQHLLMGAPEVMQTRLSQIDGSLSKMARQLEKSLERTRSPKVRANIEHALDTVKDFQAKMYQSGTQRIAARRAFDQILQSPNLPDGRLGSLVKRAQNLMTVGVAREGWLNQKKTAFDLVEEMISERRFGKTKGKAGGKRAGIGQMVERADGARRVGVQTGVGAAHTMQDLRESAKEMNPEEKRKVAGNMPAELRQALQRRALRMKGK